MIKVGLTGNIGSGKSTVAKIFSTLGVPVFYADIEAKKILERIEIVQKLESRFGNSILDLRGKIIRRNLSNIVFNDAKSLDFLNGLIHPEVAMAFTKWTKHHQNVPYIIHEAAILFESGFDRFMNEVIYVYAPQELRIERIIERDGSSLAEIEQRMKKQWDDDIKTSKSMHLIKNGKDDLLIPQVLNIHRFYIQ